METEFVLELKEKHVRETTNFMSDDCAIGRALREKFPDTRIHGIGFAHAGIDTVKFEFLPSYTGTPFNNDKKKLTGNDENVLRTFKFKQTEDAI